MADSQTFFPQQNLREGSPKFICEFSSWLTHVIVSHAEAGVLKGAKRELICFRFRCSLEAKVGGAGLSAVLTRTCSPRKKGCIEMRSESEWSE